MLRKATGSGGPQKPKGQAVLQAHREIGVFLLRKEVAALFRLADDGALFDFIVFDGAVPAGEVLTVEDAGEAGGVALAQDLVGLVRGDLAEEDVPPTDL